MYSVLDGGADPTRDRAVSVGAIVRQLRRQTRGRCALAVHCRIPDTALGNGCRPGATNSAQQGRCGLMIPLPKQLVCISLYSFLLSSDQTISTSQRPQDRGGQEALKQNNPVHRAGTELN